MESADEFAQFVMGQVKSGQRFDAQVQYDPDGDCIEFLFSDEPFYGERIDSLVTVYYGEETHEIVGSLIKGVRRFIENVLHKVPGFRIDVQDGRVKLEHLFTAKLWAESEPMQKPVVLAYQKLRDQAERLDAQAVLEGCGV